MPSPSPKAAPSPVADRIRARLGELGLSEAEAARRLGWTRSVLSALLRRLDEGGALRDDTIEKLEVVLGKPAQWIRTGVEPMGVRLADCPGWEEAARVAAERWGISPETIADVGEGRLPKPVRYVDAALIRALSDAF